MPKFSSFTGFGFLRFSSEPSEAEKIYKSMLGMYRDPADGRPTIDVTQGTYQEAKVFATSKALAAAHVTVQSAGNELKPETSYYLLEKHEKAYKVRPPANSSVVERRLVLGAKQKAARGPRFEALDEGLRAILGDDLTAIRVITTDENENWPATPGSGPGIFNRHDTIAKSIRFIDAVARKTNGTLICDQYRPGLPDGDWGILTPGMPSVAQSFTAIESTLEGARFYVKGGTSPSTVVAKLYAHSGTFGTNGIPTGAALATSGAISITAEIVSSTDYIEIYLPFQGANRVALVAGTKYFIALEYATNAELSVALVTNATYAPHAGNVAFDDGGGWDFEPSQTDLQFQVIVSTTGHAAEVAYENSNGNEADVRLLVGDVLCVDPGNLGVAERVVVTAEGIGDDGLRRFSAIFSKPHSAGAYATTGPTPIWLGSKRHFLIVVPNERAVDPTTVRRVDEFMKQITRGASTWAIVQPTTPGAATTGPFKIGSTSGDPLGAAPIDSINIVP